MARNLSPDKVEAYKQVRTAIRKGILIRPLICERCLLRPKLCRDGRSSIQAHHHDYTKPLEVEWICIQCHRDETPYPKNPGAPVFGSKNGQAKLSEDQVKSIVEMINRGMSSVKISPLFGVSRWTVSRIANGTRWTKVASGLAAAIATTK